ncbi:hypothetical protein TNCV_3625301 [Trichonephila clavipes]|nr:hypothetical protein TNCV_3625301 [Trichonephila clavipes]
MENRWQACSWPVSIGGGSMDASCPKVVSGLRNLFQASGPVTRMVGQLRNRTTAPPQHRCLILSARRQRWITAPQLAAVSGKIISWQAVHIRQTQTGLYARRLLLCVPFPASNRNNRLLWIRKLQ